MTSTADDRLRLMCASQRDIPSEVVVVLLDRLLAADAAVEGYRQAASARAAVCACGATRAADGREYGPGAARPADGKVTDGHYWGGGM